MLVDGAGDQLFPGAALAQDQDREILGATRPIALYTSCMAGERPTMMSAGASWGRTSSVSTARHAHQAADLGGPLDLFANPADVQGLSR